MAGVVEQIAISPAETVLPEPVESVELLPDQGPRGDRHFAAEPDPARREEGYDLTLIEAEALEAFTIETGIPLSHEESRRNVLTRGVRLNDLVGKRFRVGAVECEGVQLCEPCNHLQGLTRDGVLRGMVHRAGLNANVITGGTIATGDEVTQL
jgi:MOSC domain-containing protein YiiM